MKFTMEVSEMLRFVATGILAVSLSLQAAAEEGLLTIGSQAPDFRVEQFVQGEAIPALTPGAVYVIEFSGTECAPCIQMIPHIEALRRKYQQVTFASVFSEPADDIRQFLRGPGRGMTIRVACDADHFLRREWLLSSGQVGIPHVLVVDSSGKIAWIGPPDKLDAPLAKIVAGGHDYYVDPVEAMRLAIKNRLDVNRRHLRERQEEAWQLNNGQITELIKQKKFDEAIKILDELITGFSDLPLPDVIAFRARKLFLLGLVAGRRDEAFELALDIAAAAQQHLRPDVVGPAHYLLNHYERATSENRDQRINDLAVALLSNSLASAKQSDMSVVERVRHYGALARAYKLRGESSRAPAERLVAAQEEELRELRGSNGSLKLIDELEANIHELREYFPSDAVE